MKTERTHINFLSDVLVAVASLDLKVPNYCDKRAKSLCRCLLPWFGDGDHLYPIQYDFRAAAKAMCEHTFRKT